MTSIAILEERREYALRFASLRCDEFIDLMQAACLVRDAYRPHGGGDTGCDCEACGAWDQLVRAFEAILP